MQHKFIPFQISQFAFCISLICISYFPSTKICRFWVAALRKGGSCAIITNSCINFVIYCFVGRTFRRRFISTFSWVANSNCLGRNTVENCGETFPNNVEIPEYITTNAKEKHETGENPQQNLVETQGNLKKETSLDPTAGQSEEKLGNPQRAKSTREGGVSLQESFKTGCFIFSFDSHLLSRLIKQNLFRHVSSFGIQRDSFHWMNVAGWLVVKPSNF